MKYFFIFVLVTLIILPLQAQSSEELVKIALNVSPTLKALEWKQKAAGTKIAQNGNLPDPSLNLGLVNVPINTFSLTQEAMTGKIIGVTQAFPFPGKLKAQRESNGVDEQIVQQEIDDTANQIRNQVIDNYYDLVYLRHAISLTKNSRRLLEDIAEVVKTNYTVSDATQQHHIQIRLGISAAAEKLEDLRGKEQSAQAILNALLLQDTGEAILTGDYPTLPQLLPIDSLITIALSHRPLLKSVILAEHKQQNMEDLAHYSAYPQLTLSLQYTYRSQIAATNLQLNDYVSATAGVSIPLNYGGKITAKVDETKAMQNYYREQYSAAVQILKSKLAATTALLNSQSEQIRLVETVSLSQARENLEAALASYQVGKADFINVLDAKSRLLQLENKLFRLKSDFLKSLSDLEFLTGSKLFIQE